MSEVILRLKQDPVVTLEAEVITPDKFAEMSHEQICESIVYHGKRQLRLDEFFEVEGKKVSTLFCMVTCIVYVI